MRQVDDRRGMSWWAEPRIASDWSVARPTFHVSGDLLADGFACVLVRELLIEPTKESPMSRLCTFGVASIAIASVVATGTQAYARQSAEAAAAAVKASPDLVTSLAKEIGGTPEQAAGAAGALFGVAKSKLSPGDFSQVSKAVPGMDSLLAAAPLLGGGAGGALGKAAGTAGGLAAAGQAFTKLGLKPEMVSKAIPVLTSFVTKSGGAGVGNLLAGALK
jgi:hypothetical protein